LRVDEELSDFLSRGVAGLVAACDERLRPSIGRAWAPRGSDDGSRLTVCVEAPPGSAIRASLEALGTVAATFSLPSTYRTVQLKGEALALREPTAEELEAVGKHVDAFSREAETVGLPPGSGRRLHDRRLVALAFAVRELYDQTPGPNAGARL
jgi:hypothetical protein